MDEDFEETVKELKLRKKITWLCFIILFVLNYIGEVISTKSKLILSSFGTMLILTIIVLMFYNIFFRSSL